MKNISKKGIKAPLWGGIILLIMVVAIILDLFSVKLPGDVNRQSNVLDYNDTILIANDSVKDRLYSEHGLQVLKITYDKYHDDWIFKLKNVANHTIGDARELTLKLTYKVVDLKTDEIVKADYSYLRFNKFQPGEMVQLHPYIGWKAYIGVKYRVDFWIENLPMKPYFLKLNY